MSLPVPGIVGPLCNLLCLPSLCIYGLSVVVIASTNLVEHVRVNQSRLYSWTLSLTTLVLERAPRVVFPVQPPIRT